ncbi:hypothetical protein C6Y14_22845 [Streptomyces dioscori]|uniref:Nucleotidyltransferase family protein n=1 Tax=Streptomyces dioscori TaxID=2109333 RepID=A0A2P8Q3M0_9ACTN|nr:nucleotidyltransferase family protein [Streptomyces dioscori]PSM40856.1 hypothetical protein C6Y14_22845 [Streptomyces dioscori]
MRASELIASVGPHPESVAAAWRDHMDAEPPRGSGEPLVDWSHVLVLALRHQVCRLLWDALEAASLADRVPVGIAEELCFHARTTETRHEELTAALRELAEAEPEVVARSVLLKGGALLGEYGHPAHRPMNDFDVLFSAADFEAVEPRFAELGYWRKESLNGPTYYRDRAGPGGPLCMDVHVAGPSKYWRPESALGAWLDDTEPLTGPGGVLCRRLSPEFELLNVVTHLHEHLGSWIHTLGDDDIALVRVCDVELLAERRPVDLERCWRLAVAQGLHGEFALGLWAVDRLRGGLPGPLSALAPAVERVAAVGEFVALPGGTAVEWSVPLRERAFLTDRTDLVFEALHKGLPDPERIRMADVENIDAWRNWYQELGARSGYRERVENLGARARDLLSGLSVN